MRMLNVFIMVLLLPVLVMADTFDAPNMPDGVKEVINKNRVEQKFHLPAVIQDLQLGGAQFEVIDRFDAPLGLIGWKVVQNGKHSLLYTGQDGQIAIFGVMVGRGGENITAKHIGAENLGVDGNKGAANVFPDEKVTKALESASQYFREGSRSLPTMWIVYEPQCPACSQFYEVTRKYAGKVAFNWVPVAFLDESSLSIGAELLSMDGAAANKKLADIEAMKRSGQRPGAVEGVAQEYEQKVRDNTILMSLIGVDGTPFVAWRDQDGKAEMFRGAPPEELMTPLVKMLRGEG